MDFTKRLTNSTFGTQRDAVKGAFMYEIGPEIGETTGEIEGKKVYLDTDNRPQQGGDRVTHLPNGKFAPANALGGRAKRADERAIIAAMDKALPPDKLSQAIQDALAWAYEYKSWKAILAISQFVVAYQIGQPVQRSVSASGKLENILSRLSSMEDSEFEAVERAMRGDVDGEIA